MRSRMTLICFAVTFHLSASFAADDVESLMENMFDMQQERWEGVETYVIDQTQMTIRVQRYFQRINVTTPDGETYIAFRNNPLSTDPCSFAAEGGFSEMTAEDYEQAAQAYEMTGEAMGSEIDAGLEDAGLPRGLLSAPGGNPWETMDPRGIMGAGAIMMRAGAEAKRQQAIEEAKPDTTLSDMQMFADRARLVGTESVDGREAFHVRAEDLNLTQESDGQTFTIDSVDSWIDAQEYVPLRMVLEGVAQDGRESRPIRMEKRDLDYRKVPESNMYESYKQVMTISGVMDEKQQAEMQQIQQQMADFERQIATMPKAQQDMIRRQMAPQMEMLNSMSSGSGMQLETVINAITVNHCDKAQAGQMPFGPEAFPFDVGAAGTGSPGGGGGGEIAAPVAAGGVAAYNLVTDDDEVEVRPYYVDEEGIGVLRYSEPKGRVFQYHMVISGLTANPERPREVLVGSMGPYNGPDVGIFIGSLRMLSQPYDLIEIELYEDEPYRPVVRFRPQVNADKAESMEDCGTVSSTGACSNALPRQ